MMFAVLDSKESVILHFIGMPCRWREFASVWCQINVCIDIGVNKMGLLLTESVTLRFNLQTTR